MIEFFKKHKYIFLVLIPLYLIVYYFTLVPVNYSVTSPGGITTIDSKIVIDEDFDLSGSINSVYVLSIDRPTRFMNMLYSLNSDVESSKMNDKSSLLTNAELLESSRLSYVTGLTSSLIASYNLSEKEIEYSLRSIYVSYIDKSVANNDIEIGDELVLVNGETFNSYDEFIALSTKNDKVTYTTIEGEEKTAEFVDGKLGIYVDEMYEITNSEVDYEILQEDGYGNSGGLLQSLSLYMQLTEQDLTKGRVIAGTGSIDMEGNVGRIGGIKQKIITTIKLGVDVFLCPSEHYEEALEVYENYDTDMELVSVKTLEEAVNYLNA